MIVRAGLSKYDSGGETKLVKSAIYNSKYDAATNDYDIAVLTLSSPLIYSSEIQPIKLRIVRAPTEADAIVSGYGTTISGGPLSNGLMEIYVPIVDQKLCKSDYGGAITKRMVCAGFSAGGKDPSYRYVILYLNNKVQSFSDVCPNNI